MAYILIVDDDADCGLVAAHVLRDCGHEVRLELDTESALRSMGQWPPDLAVLDVMFPENSSAGFELARAMRHHNDRLKGIPILFLTAVNQRFPLGFSARDLDETWLPADALPLRPHPRRRAQGHSAPQGVAPERWGDPAAAQRRQCPRRPAALGPQSEPYGRTDAVEPCLNAAMRSVPLG